MWRREEEWYFQIIKELCYNGKHYSLSMYSSWLYHKPSLSKLHSHTVMPTPACCQHRTTLRPQKDSYTEGGGDQSHYTHACLSRLETWRLHPALLSRWSQAKKNPCSSWCTKSPFPPPWGTTWNLSLVSPFLPLDSHMWGSLPQSWIPLWNLTRALIILLSSSFQPHVFGHGTPLPSWGLLSDWVFFLDRFFRQSAEVSF